MKKVLIFFGGFSQTGGIESFFEDLMHTCKNSNNLDLYFAAWGRDLLMIKGRVPSGVKFILSRFCWGCRFGFPDLVLAFKLIKMLNQVDKVVVGKTPSVMASLIIKFWSIKGSSRQLIYITPYRPIEIWGDKLPSSLKRLVDIFFVQSVSFKQDLLDAGYSGSIIVNPYIPPYPASFNHKSYILRNQYSKVKLLFLGRFVKQKNLLYLIEICKNMEDVELHLVGNGPMIKELTKIISEGVGNVFIHPSVARSEVLRTFDFYDAHVVSSTSEGQCLTVIEGLSRGKPVIGTPVGAIPEILANKNFGTIMPLDNISEAKKIMHDFVSDVRADKYSVTKILSDYSRIFNREKIELNYVRSLEE